MHFLVEEDAYDVLSDYLAHLENVLEHVHGKKEIIEDIELRIAELCQLKCTSKKEVIDLTDVQSILDTLGNPDDYIETEESTFTVSSNEKQKKSAEKRLFRDPENGMIAGVCSGIAAYFGLDVVIIRALFVLTFLTVGFGAPFYVILWIIVPKATSSIDKLRMQGKPITVDSVKVEVEQATERLKSTTSSWYKRLRNKKRNDNTLVRIARFLLKIVGYFILSLGISIFIALVILLFNLDNLAPIEFNGHQITLSELNNLVFERSSDATWGYIGIVMALISFMFFLLISGSALVFTLKSKLIKYSSWTSLGIGLIGLIICIAIGLRTANAYQEEVKINRVYHTYAGDTLSISTISKGIFTSKNEQVDIDEDLTLNVEGDRIIIHGIELNYQQSSDSLFRIIHQLSARGYSSKEAVRRIKNIRYRTALNGNRLVLPTFFSFPKIDHLRDQKAQVIIEIPIGKCIELNGKKIVFDTTMRKSEDLDYLGGGSLDPTGNYSEW
jgi:phage shock protein PspC (stress-responsive transcriptional regulator)